MTSLRLGYQQQSHFSNHRYVIRLNCRCRRRYGHQHPNDCGRFPNFFDVAHHAAAEPGSDRPGPYFV